MQYIRGTIGSVSKTWNSINPSTLSGAIDVVAVERADGEINCSPFHIRFGKFVLLRPTHKGVEFSINGEPTNIPMKLGEGGEAFFVFETEEDVPASMLTSPVASPAQSAMSASSDSEPDFLDINDPDSHEEHEVPPSKEELDAGKQKWMQNTTPDKMDELIGKLKDVNIPSTTNDRGEVIIDMTGYKPEGQNTRELENVVDQILSHDISHAQKHHGDPSQCEDSDAPDILHHDERLANVHDQLEQLTPATPPLDEGQFTPATPATPQSPSSTMTRRRRHFVKTLRLTSDMLKGLKLRKGRNEMSFRVRESRKAIVTANIYFWDSKTPVVISDIDGTITKSDAMGHVMNLIGRDWTHEGVGKLFTDIHNNGYNIMYLTARAVGQAQATRNYLDSVAQAMYKLPQGPVILSPDRLVAAFHREVVMRKPEIFKMACLRDIAKLYGGSHTPFYAGFGNRITDALSYRSVDVPSTRIFTIDTNSEVRMELLELTGYKSSYVLITDLVDHFFPPIEPEFRPLHTAETIDFTDANYWRVPLPQLSDDETSEASGGEEEDDDDEESVLESLDFKPRVTATFDSGSSDEYTTDSEASASDLDDDAAAPV